MSIDSRLEKCEQVARLVAAERRVQEADFQLEVAKEKLAAAEAEKRGSIADLKDAKLQYRLESKVRAANAELAVEVPRVEPLYRAMCASPDWQRIRKIASQAGGGGFWVRMQVVHREEEVVCLVTGAWGPDCLLPTDRSFDLPVAWWVEEPFDLQRGVERAWRVRAKWKIASVASFSDLANPIPVTQLKHLNSMPYIPSTVGEPETVLPIMARHLVDLVARDALVPLLVDQLSKQLIEGAGKRFEAL